MEPTTRRHPRNVEPIMKDGVILEEEIRLPPGALLVLEGGMVVTRTAAAETTILATTSMCLD